MSHPALNYIIVSDIHLFHRRTPTSHIVSALWDWFIKYDKAISKCSVLFLAGDVFDRFIPSHYPDITTVNQFFYKLGLYLKSKNIRIRALEGTIIHDRRQFQNILPILEATGVDVKYHATVTVEWIDGVSVLYVPDNWKLDMHETFLDAKAAISAEGIPQCDIAIMHGAFEYQLPMMPSVTFNQHDFESIIKYAIHVGHVHIPSKKGKVYAQGSFDRVSHGEPGDKGGHVYINGKVTRLTNHNSFPYRSIHLPSHPNMSMDQIEALIKTTVEEMGHQGWLRIQCDKYHRVIEHLPRIQSGYIGVKFERQYISSGKEETSTNAPVVEHLSTEAILASIKDWDASIPDNVLSLIEKKLTDGDARSVNTIDPDGT